MTYNENNENYSFSEEDYSEEQSILKRKTTYDDGFFNLEPEITKKEDTTDEKKDCYSDVDNFL